MKDIEWLKEEVLDNKFMGHTIHIDVLFELMDQLDEPEVLSQEWISDNAVVGQYPDGMGYVVPAYKLQNLLVPKQELPVIPKFVAEFLIGKEDYMLYELFDDEWLYKEHDRVAKWLYDNDELTNRQREIDLVMARVRGCVVEEEQKYRVIFPSVDENGKGFNYLAKDTYHNELWVEDSRTDGLDWEERSSFTEDEIRDLDKGDILFEHFTVKVEEMEE